MSAVIGNPLLLGPEGYQISRSVRLRSSASAYFNRTQTAGSQTTWTWSGWLKRGKLTTAQYLMQAGGSSGSGVTMSVIADDFQIETGNGTTQHYARSTAQYRDPSAWYHVVMVCNTTSATSTLTGTPSDRLQIWVNGVQVTSFSASSIPTQNFAGYINQNTVAANIGRWNGATPNYYFDGYLTEVNFIDGQALTPSSFGETDAVTGVWKPKKYTGTYGTNGFYLNFSDNSNNTATTIGKDYSGNGNNWTPNNISVTSGVTYDSMLDVPTPYADGGNGRGNYAVLNPLDRQSTNAVVSAGNLDLINNVAAAHAGIRATIGISTPTYWEVTYNGDANTRNTMGIADSTVVGVVGSVSNSAGMYTGGGVGTLYFWANGTANIFSVSGSSGSVLQFAYDQSSGKFWVGQANAWYNSTGGTTGNPATGANPTFTFSNPPTMFPYGSVFNQGANSTLNFNFGQRPFTYTPPSGFKALNTQNLPDSTIKKGNQYFDTLLWTSNASVKSVTGSAFQPDLVWVKDRGSASANEGYHHLVDSVRGAGNVLSSNATLAEYWSGTNNSVTAFNSNGFTTGIYDGLNGDSMVTWLWKESAASGFDIVTYTGNGTNRTIAHSLGVAPSMIIIKCRDSATDPSWIVGHTGIGMGTGRLILNGTDANSNAGASSLWNSTAATSSVFSLGTYSSVNQNTLRFVAYLFSEVAGFSRMGSYQGNGSSDGSFVYCGFRPRWIMVKRTDTSGYYWWIVDTARNTYNALENAVYAQASDAETTGWYTDSLANGFKIRNSGLHMNASGGTYIFAAFAENPFKNALAR